MSKATCVLTTFLLILASSSLTTAQNNLPPRLKWKEFTLSNGLRVLLIPDPAETEIAVEFWVHVGSRDEPPGKHGFAHFFEHATPYGLTKDEAARNAYRSNRTNSNAQTLKDYTRYYVQVKPAGLELALRYTAERMNADLNSVLESTTETHRTNVLNEMARQETNPFYGPIATSARYAATFGANHPYGHSNYGTLEENRAFTVNEIKEWYSKYFFPKNMILFVSGKFDSMRVKALISQSFSGINRMGSRTKRDYAVRTQSRESIVKSKPTNHMLTLTWPISSWGAKEDPLLHLLAKVLDARLAREKPSMFVTTGSSELLGLYELAGQFGMFGSFAFLKDRGDAEGFLLQTLNKVARDGVTESELQIAKSRLIDEVKEAQKNLGFISSRTELLGEGLLFKGTPDFYFQRLKKQQKLNGRDVQRMASAVLRATPARVLVMAETKCDDPALCK